MDVIEYPLKRRCASSLLSSHKDSQTVARHCQILFVMLTTRWKFDGAIFSIEELFSKRNKRIYPPLDALTKSHSLSYDPVTYFYCQVYQNYYCLFAELLTYF